MTQIGLLVRFETKPEYAAEFDQLLRDALELARAEEGTVTWFSFREGENRFGVFDTFADEAGRTAHLEGAIAAALMERAPKMLVAAPEIQRIDVLAAKLS
jgi:quinol monooxygenase YgiN